MFGALGGVLPVRLGGTATNGWTAAQQSRAAADAVAVARSLPFATLCYSKSGAAVTVLSYSGKNGNGAGYAPTGAVNGTGDVTFTWEPIYDDGFDDARPVSIRGATAAANSTTATGVTVELVGANAVRVRTYSDTIATLRVWGGPEIAVLAAGDYGGEPDKRDSDTEGDAPYSDYILRDIQAQRGSAYSQSAGRLVDAENLALARYWAAIGPRNAEKFRANMLPGTSDERLPYWQALLAIPLRPTDPKWARRRKLANHYRGTRGASQEEVREALEGLLGDAFVDMSWEQGTDIATPPDPTKWPDVDAGNPADSLGGGAWLSSRNHLFVEVEIPSSLTVGEFLTLMHVEFKALLDRMLPAWATFDWATSDGFTVATDDATGDGSRIDFDGV
jgi:hypothetical protein